jgi:pimeloyl-ACP methyl ester carboxylesterase
VEDVRGLLGFVGQKKAIVVGHDAGAFAAWAFAATYLEATERLIACANGQVQPSVQGRRC